MKKSVIHKNAIFSLAQVIIASFSIFISYKYLIITLGAEKLGVWSLLLASVSILNIGNLGLSSTVVKYVAKYLVTNDSDKISKIIETSILTVFTAAVILLSVVFLLAKILLQLIVPAKYLILSLTLLPFSLINLIIILIMGIILSSLDGAQKFYVRNLILISSALLFLFLIFVLVPIFDLFGVIYAQIAQSLFTLIVGWLLLRKEFPYLSIIPYHWNRKAFNEIIHYSLNLQLISIFQLLYEPVTKSLLTLFGGLSYVGYYEMANRMVLKFRELIVSIFQVLVPVYATNIEDNTGNIKELYIKSFNYLFFLTVPFFAFLIIILPVISKIWLGRFEITFYTFSLLLFIAWFINMLNVPAYFAFLGIGNLKWNVLSHFLIGVLNIILCYFIGKFFGGIGVIVGWTASLALGSIIISIMFNKIQQIKLREIITKENKFLFVINSFAVIIFISFQILIVNVTLYLLLNGILIILFILISTYFVWTNPIRMNLFNSVKIIFLTKSH